MTAGKKHFLTDHKTIEASSWGGVRSKIAYSLFFVIIDLVTVFSSVLNSIEISAGL